MRWRFRPYVSVARRRAKAAREVARLEKRGQKTAPVVIGGRAIATTFWGRAWCDNLESYSDFENRLPRGRTYVRNGSVVDLQIASGRVTALVSGSDLYTVTIRIKPLATSVWKSVRSACAGQIASLIELLQGRLSQRVMEVVTRREDGLFPKPAEIDMDCSCPDWAGMCKHVAATLYGVGARLDEQPELLFQLRKVDHLELIAAAGDATAASLHSKSPSRNQKVIAADDLADVFGIELDAPATSSSPAPEPAPGPRSARASSRKQAPPKARSAASAKGRSATPLSAKPREASRRKAATNGRKQPRRT